MNRIRYTICIYFQPIGSWSRLDKARQLLASFTWSSIPSQLSSQDLLPASVLFLTPIPSRSFSFIVESFQFVVDCCPTNNREKVFQIILGASIDLPIKVPSFYCESLLFLGENISHKLLHQLRHQQPHVVSPARVGAGCPG